MEDQDQVAADTIQHTKNIHEVIAVIGFNGQGVLAVEAPGVDGATLAVMLEQMRQAVIGAIRYQKERKVVPISGGRIPHLNENGRH